MPADPRDPHAEERRQDRIRRYDEAMIENGHRDETHLTAQAIADCPMCDEDGYRGLGVCDHRDHHESTSRGRAAVQAVLDRRPRSENRQRTELVALRLLPGEHQAVQAAAIQAGVSVSQFIRDAALEAAR
ncbi:plasmid mobilization protein [Mycobacterium sp. NPDC050041]|uniref:plasmid mobilization protein n=1 Tax=Mycobacterium sp. NPDC050041 TaxID=3364293 RepID=UPI003C2D2CF6